MARLKDGVDFYSLDTDFFSDDKIKLIKSEFGAKGIAIIIFLLCEIYRVDGYYKLWDEDSPLLISEGLGCGCSAEFISQVVTRCVKRSIFNERLFNVFHVLTSTGIQRRYLRGCSTRDEIRIRQEYWLLDMSIKKDVPPSILKKITFFSDSLQNNPNDLQKKSDSLQKKTHSIVDYSRLKDSRESGAVAPTPTLNDVKNFCSEKGLCIDPERFFNYYKGNGWVTSNGQPVVDWQSIACNWNKTEKQKSQPARETSYDLSEIEKLNAIDMEEI